MIVRLYRRPKGNKDPILRLVTCNGCVTPKLCKKKGKCDCQDEIEEKRINLEKETKEMIEKIHPSMQKPNRLSKTSRNKK